MQFDAPLEKEFRLNELQKKAFKKLHIETVGDLLYHFPTRYGDTSEMRSIATLKKGDVAVLFGTISNLKTSKAYYKKIPMGEGKISDDTGSIKAIWFHQPYLAKMIAEGALVRAEGKVSERKGELYLSNPKIETVPKLPIAVGSSLFGKNDENHALYPIYPESRGVTSNWMYHAIQKIFKSGLLDTIPDEIPEPILKKYNLPKRKTALVWIHAPQNKNDGLAARKRFAFEEVFFIQLQKRQARLEYEKHKSFVIEPESGAVEKFVARFPFKPTVGQERAIQAIIADFKKDRPMSRLLEGDVGSGKTAVAATTVYATLTGKPKGQNFGHLQTAYMCPTEILAKQHFDSFITYFAHLGVQIGLITGSGCRKFPSKINPHDSTDISRTQLLKWVANGEIPILFGTHALIQKSVRFKHLAYVIIDEQHRFGVSQRKALAHTSALVPHFLSMTATPIPRTLALTIYGDLDLTVLSEMPAGRKPIKTEIVIPGKREEAYEKIRHELLAGRQAYVICPRIDEPDPSKEMALNVKSVKEEAKRLKKDVFPEYEIAILHSKMKPAEKDSVMEKFKDGRVHILVATSVVEVGVNVPNATVIVIEGAERFGLAQLHQLRGRVIRSNEQAYCFVFAETKTENTLKRLKALEHAKNGFELAEEDLKARGAGELYGRKQWGLSDMAMEALKNIKMVEAARTEATALIETDPNLSTYPLLAERLKKSENKIHFE
ncbi:MAG: hypothetical protein A2836_03005 [Candidatus Taylorbacteria bacterium RIFCSPHIGHO2_01_FULL_45_63]|uniref:Probable DNA 3'-5' helicase RecG n=1 Tax=Candidatus Taylorbacteria bacterium RIFCSPHIGHO2_02_FULL_45_35 TaxID=1802311 RepID=A0A1G2MVZ6_9BACT|nr:MAG: hypothetical protein A2836_03005 [Candidatus Taylorbacteria bacterium RIFCSPHIGHO2_01_FULL_45_63]OHA28015.1 MAG: hypothetical protein A3D56_00260 [Candidatus Taylorbacteria bacterium RIFCSPHIGHO2_02_FULL_45_35]OHA34958.1 MAG: hypothetical protein A3A22_00220 [Candidatus Taylorbacteria bacterium RIFCSPLOWO2_01_FULL_45_34b]